MFMCASGVIHCIGDSRDIRFMGSFICLYALYFFVFDGFEVCYLWNAFLAGLHSRDLILDMFSTRYANIFGFLLLFRSTIFHLFYFVLCGEFIFFPPSYCIAETGYNMV